MTDQHEECFCEGNGARNTSSVGVNPGYAYPYFLRARSADICSCPAGQAFAEGMRRNEDALHEKKSRLAWGEAGIPNLFYDYTLDSSPAPSAAKDACWQWVQSGAWSLYLYGPTGVGKTGLAIGTLHSLVFDEYSTAVKFVVVPELLDRIRSSYRKDDGSHEKYMKTLREASTLVLDDIGIGGTSEWVENTLFSLIGYRHGEELMTIYTSNYSPRELATKIGERTTWRIVERCTSHDGEDYVVKVAGPNLRDRTAAE